MVNNIISKDELTQERKMTSYYRGLMLEMKQKLTKERKLAFYHRGLFLEKKLENNKLQEDIKELTVRAERWEEDAKCHYDAIGRSEVWNKDKEKVLRKETAEKEEVLNKERQEHEEQVKSLKKEVAEKMNLLQTANANLERAQGIIEQKDKEISEKDNQLEKAVSKSETQDKRIELLESELYLFQKPLPPLPKKQRKVRKLLTGLKTKFQQSIKKSKKQETEMIAKMEIKTK